MALQSNRRCEELFFDLRVLRHFQKCFHQGSGALIGPLDGLLPELVLIGEKDLPRRADWGLLTPLPGMRRDRYLHQVDLLAQEVVHILSPGQWRHVLEEGLVAEPSSHKAIGISLDSQNGPQLFRGLWHVSPLLLLHNAHSTAFVHSSLQTLGADGLLAGDLIQRRSSGLHILKLFHLGRKIVIRRFEGLLN